MKIIQMNLDDFGIYHNVMWNPPEKGLIVMHGRNESGIFAGRTDGNIGFIVTKRNLI